MYIFNQFLTNFLKNLDEASTDTKIDTKKLVAGFLIFNFWAIYSQKVQKFQFLCLQPKLALKSKIIKRLEL